MRGALVTVALELSGRNQRLTGELGANSITRVSRVFKFSGAAATPSTARDRVRRMALIAHRYVGLALAVFLVVAGLTGALLAFYKELDRALSAELMDVTPPSANARPLDPFELTARLEAQLPAGERLHSVRFDAEPDRALGVWIETKAEGWQETYVDPYTGKVLGARDWGFPERRAEVMPFIYTLHYSLALGEVGSYLFGIAALLWTIDCFVGAYLTFPRSKRQKRAAPRSSWFLRWVPAWLVKTRQLGSFMFTFHRASGLWLWAMLLVFAWSAVAFNLREVYTPVMATLTGMKPSGHDMLPELAPPFPEPALSLREAHTVGKKLMAEEAKRRGFTIERELYLYYAEDHGAFAYGVESSLDLSSSHPRTEVYFDRNGRFMNFEAQTGISTGNTISSLFTYLHLAAVGGLGYKLFVSIFGIAVAALSASGVWVWWRKRVRKSRRRDAAEPAEPAESAGILGPVNADF